MTSHISHIHDNIYFMLSLDHPTNITKISWGVKWPPQAAGHFFWIPPQKKHGFQQLSAAKSTNSQLKKWASCPISDLQDLLCYCIFTYFWSDLPYQVTVSFARSLGPIFNSIDVVHGKLILHDLGCIKSRIIAEIPLYPWERSEFQEFQPLKNPFIGPTSPSRSPDGPAAMVTILEHS